MGSAAPDQLVAHVRDASRRLVRELGFMRGTLAGTELPPSAVHALVEIGRRGPMTAAALGDLLALEKSSVSRMVRKLIQSGELAETRGQRDGRTKLLSLTDRGRATLTVIDAFAERQVLAALRRLPDGARPIVLDGLSSYASALRADRLAQPVPSEPVPIETGYRPGLLGRLVEMHGRYYAREWGFGAAFEARVAAGLAEFAGRPGAPGNEIWSAWRSGALLGGLAVDGQDLGSGKAHLRWFIVDDGQRGAGLGLRLLSTALDFCDRSGFGEVHLWTFRGLDAARRLYERHGFTLVEEWPGDQWGKRVMEQRFVRKPPESSS